MTTKAQLEQAQKLAALHLEWRDPKKTHPDRVETFTKEWQTKKGEDRAKKLDYVGHANLRDILCYADPLWTWHHGGYDANGNRVPLIDRDSQNRARGIWIDLTVHGVTKPGYGTVSADVDVMNAMKELIGDALRNAAQSFGIAVCLWARIELAELEAHYGQDAETYPPGNDAPDDVPAPIDRQPQADDRPDPAAALASAPAAEAEAPQAPASGACPSCYAPPGHSHATKCASRQANGEAPAPEPEADDREEEVPQELTMEQVKADLAKWVTNLKGDGVQKFITYRRVNNLPPDDLNKATDDQLRRLHAWLSAQPVARAVPAASSG